MADPQIYGPDGVLRTEVIFSTSKETRFFTGTIPTDAVDVQVSINGSGFSSDTSQIDWADGSWTVPNPDFEPNGLTLLQGANTIAVRAVLPTGSVTPSASATVRLVSSADLGVTASVPTNIGLERFDAFVRIRAEASSDTGFRGMNFYASTSQGGGVSGYTRVNLNPVSEGTPTEETESFGSLEVDAAIVVNAEDEPVADPMFFRLKGSQQDENEVALQEDFDQTFEVPETTREVRISTTLLSVRDVTLYEFDHDRGASPTSTPKTIRVGSFAVLPADQPLYYVVTATYYDSARNVEYESSYSEEVVGGPAKITTALTSIPTVSRQDIVTQFISAVFRSNPQVKVEVGSVLRDTVIDPFASESERIRFIFDFFQRARTPTLLLQKDDPKGSGTSVPVSQSPYKQALQAALYLDSATEVQNVIDAAFDAYASNYGKKRRSGTSSATEAIFYTTRRPTATLLIPLGTVVSGGGSQFTTTRAASIDFSRLASFYDPVSGRYKVTVPVRCTSVGSTGNVGVGQISTIVSSLSGSLSVTNTAAATGGLDRESNLALVTRVQNALASVDSGTAQGYRATAADVPGVVKANVVSAGNALMQRDLDTDGTHRGGKVDVWVQGENLATVTDGFSFTFDIAQDIQFEIIGDPSDYKFRALDSELSESNPIVEMLDDADAGYEMRNATTGEVFDLTNVVILTYDTIQLNTDLTQPSVDLSDVVLASYRRRSGNRFVFPRQPVSEIVSVVGTISGEIPADAFSLVHPDSPLDAGKSTLAQDYLEITPFEDDSGSMLPSGGSISVTDEEHVLTGQYPEYLDNLGANFLTVVVKDSTGTTTYKGPNDPSGSPDYTINLGTSTTALSITRVEAGDIESGATVLISYEHDENFEVTYKTNLIVSQTQSAIDAKKHATADVIAKEALAIPLDIEGTVVLIKGRVPSDVDTAIRTNLSNFFSNLRLGNPVRQSDIIGVIEKTEGVSYVVVPLHKMVPTSGTSIVQESISTDTAAESSFLTSLSTNKASVYILENPLSFATDDAGGESTEFRGVFQNDVALTLLEASASLSGLGVAAGRAYIIGSSGRSLQGYSDDATIEGQGYVTAEAIQNRREELTANHILVSLAVGASPTSYNYACTYVVGTDSEAKNVDPSDAQYVSEGTLLFTYDEDSE